MDLHEAAKAIDCVIEFARTLPRWTNNRMNAERRIRQRETRRAESRQSTMSQEQELRRSPVPLPPPGVGAYRPPMLREAPPHLKFEATRSGTALAAAPSTPSVHEVDSCCRGATAVPIVNLADASTQTNMEIPPINPQKYPENSEKSTEKSEKSLENSGNTSYGNIEEDRKSVV